MRLFLGVMLWLVGAGVWLPAGLGVETGQTDLPVIGDQPKTIDPAELMPAGLAARATVDLSHASLGELVDWLRESQELVVLLDRSGLDDAGVLPSEPLSDRLLEQPIYLLLDRLRFLDLGWYFENQVLYITSAAEVQHRLTTAPYNIGDLLDAGYEVDDLVDAITLTIAPVQWEVVGGPGAVSVIGDVMFVRQTEAIQRKVQGLLAALREHARQTLILDPPQHELFRQQLEENVTVEFADVPLETAVRQLSEISGVDIRLDRPALRALRVREREPVTVRLVERQLQTVLQAMMLDLGLSWTLRDGVLWITSPDEAGQLFKTAVYDVRDLCRDRAESEALRGAVTSQLSTELWEDLGGPGSICFARPGTLVVRHREPILREVLELLEAYRTALRASRPRERDVADPEEVLTVYYRMYASVAEDLMEVLPTLVRPESWRSETQPEAPGQMVRVRSAPEAPGAGSGLPAEPSGQEVYQGLLARAVLIITQTRAAHEEIAEVIRRVEAGDPPTGLPDESWPGAGGMGGFGGGFF